MRYATDPVLEDALGRKVQLGLHDARLALGNLFGFGLDSFIEMISGIGIVYMITRIRANPKSARSDFEKTALKITGYSFYLLVIGLTLSAAINIYLERKPDTTLWGVVISLISIEHTTLMDTAKRPRTATEDLSHIPLNRF